MGGPHPPSHKQSSKTMIAGFQLFTLATFQLWARKRHLAVAWSVPRSGIVRVCSAGTVHHSVVIQSYVKGRRYVCTVHRSIDLKQKRRGGGH